jgi:hypothetical protein
VFGLGKRSQQPKEAKEIRGEIVESVDDMTGRVLTDIKQKGKTVEVVIRSRVDGSKLFEVTYQTEATGRHAQFVAEQLAGVYIDSHNLYEDVKLSNIDIGHFRMSNKRTR